MAARQCLCRVHARCPSVAVRTFLTPHPLRALPRPGSHSFARAAPAGLELSMPKCGDIAYTYDELVQVFGRARADILRASCKTVRFRGDVLYVIVAGQGGKGQGKREGKGAAEDM